jgi:hypothetical protein
MPLLYLKDGQGLFVNGITRVFFANRPLRVLAEYFSGVYDLLQVMPPFHTIANTMSNTRDSCQIL